ncbi:hypothetical protein TWF281_003876 [Arthrobotrys megalospora]
MSSTGTHSPDIISESHCLLDRLPDEIHLEILSNIDFSDWKTQIPFMQAYPRWSNILQDRKYSQNRYGNRSVPDNLCHHRLLLEAVTRDLVCIVREGVIISAKLNRKPQLGIDEDYDDDEEEQEFFWRSELGGPGVLDDPVFCQQNCMETHDSEDPRFKGLDVKGIMMDLNPIHPWDTNRPLYRNHTWTFNENPRFRSWSIREFVEFATKNVAEVSFCQIYKRYDVRIRYLSTYSRFCRFMGRIEPIVEDEYDLDNVSELSMTEDDPETELCCLS